MIDFLLEYYRTITFSIEILAAVTGLLLYKKYKCTAAKYFIWFLLIVTIFEIIGGYTKYVRPDQFLSFLIGTKFEKNHWLSTIRWKIGAIMFYVFYFNQILKTPLFKNIIKYAGTFFFVFSIIYIGFHWDAFFYQFFSIISVLGAAVILLCAMLYFIEILNSDNLLAFYKSINFYISAAIFIWWLIITPLSFYSTYFTYEVGKRFFDLDFVFLRNQIYLFTNIIMYLTFIFAFIWCRPEND